MTCFIWHFNKVLNFCCLLQARWRNMKKWSELGDLGTFLPRSCSAWHYFLPCQFRVNCLQVLNKPNHQEATTHGKCTQQRVYVIYHIYIYIYIYPWQQYNFSIMFECSGWSWNSTQTVRSVSTFTPSSHWSGNRQTIWKTILFTASGLWMTYWIALVKF